MQSIQMYIFIIYFNVILVDNIALLQNNIISFTWFIYYNEYDIYHAKNMNNFHNSFINVLPFMALLSGLPVNVICVSILNGMPKNVIEWVPSLLHGIPPTIQPERRLRGGNCGAHTHETDLFLCWSLIKQSLCFNRQLIWLEGGKQRKLQILVERYRGVSASAPQGIRTTGKCSYLYFCFNHPGKHKTQRQVMSWTHGHTVQITISQSHQLSPHICSCILYSYTLKLREKTNIKHVLNVH